MKFLFLSTAHKPLHAYVLNERPFGGGTGNIVHFARALKNLGHEVYVTTRLENPPSSEPHYLFWQQAYEIDSVDVLIGFMGWESLFIFPIQYKKCFYWTGDNMSNPRTLGLGDKRVINKLDRLLLKSSWQTSTVCEASGFPLDKTHLLPNGVNLEDFRGIETRHRKRLIYASTPVRGLTFLPDIFQDIKQRHPDAELYVYSSFDRYMLDWKGLPAAEDDKFKSTFQALASMKGCFVNKSILQKNLARELMKSAILMYPTHFFETCCNLTLQAQAAGCVPITSDLASLPETVKDAGLLIKGTPNDAAYRRAFVDGVDRLLSDDALFNKLSAKGMDAAKHFDWKNRAEAFIEYLSNEHGLK
jgi:glycosyltransferase involved in cell wall biosynthesis